MLDFITVALKNVFSKPATRNYPKIKRKLFDNQRGHIEIGIDDCIFCGICQKKCPVGAITVNRQEKTWSVDRFKCIVCSYCAESCPKKCIAVKSEYTDAAFTKSVDIYKAKTIDENKGKGNA